MNNGLVYFNNGGGSGSGSNEYDKDVFKDITVAANSNTGFSNIPAKNPLGAFFLNDDLPKYSVKTLWIKNISLIQNRSLWINNKPTYQILFDEQWPGVYAYAAGDIRARNNNNGISLDIRQIDDIFGLSGVIRRVMFLVEPSGLATATADILVDGVDTTRDITVSNSSASTNTNGYNKFSAFVHGSSNEDKEIHDYRITPNQQDAISVVGVIVYYQNASSDIDLFPGSTYVNKDKKTTTSITTAGFTTISSPTGANTLIYKTPSDTYAQDVLLAQTQITTGSGSATSTSIDVTTGHGASFMAGYGIAAGAGSTYYVGTVTNISTDTLTVSPSLPFNLVGATLHKLWYAGTTVTIGTTYYSLKYSLDAQLMNVLNNPNGFGLTGTGNFYYSTKEQDARVWGRNILNAEINGYAGLAFSSTVNGFIQVDGYFSAAEIEVVGAGFLDYSASVNGVASTYAYAATLLTTSKFTVFSEAGPGWNSFNIVQGTSFTNCVITKINLYSFSNNGITFGKLASYSDIGSQISRGTLSASMMQIGTHRRVYADSLFLQGSWVLGQTFTAAGGNFYYGSSTNSKILFQWYGKDIALIGTAASAATLVIDGLGSANTFNSMISIASEGFHTLEYTVGSGATALIAAIDYTRTRDEFINLQNTYYDPTLSNLPKVYEQTVTPGVIPPGSIWGLDPDQSSVWMYLFNRWYKLNISAVSDNPNIGTIVYAGGEVP